VGEHRGSDPGLAYPLVDNLEEPLGRSLGAARADHSPSHRSACDRDARRSEPGHQMAQAGRRECGKGRVAVHPGQRDGGDSERRDGGNTLRCVERQAQRPHPAQRRANDRHLIEAKRVKQRGELGNRVRAQRSARVVERIAQPRPRKV
jgi:hypothetical protein